MPKFPEAKLAESPWPKGAEAVIFIIDARSSFERSILEDWISRHDKSGVPSKVIPLELGDDRKPLNVGALDRAIVRLPNAVVAPLRIAWVHSRRSIQSGPRLVDFLRGSDYRPSLWRQKYLAEKRPERMRLVLGEPGSLDDLSARFKNKYQQEPAARPADFSIFVARQAAIVLDMGERKLRGGRYKVPRYVVHSLRNNPDFQEKLRAIADERQVPLAEVQREVNDYFGEMISVPNHFWLDVFAKISNLCLSLGYEPELRYDKSDLERIRAMVREYPSALLWTHKTYLDGFAVPKIMFENDFPMPHMFGGANLNFPGLGFLLRRSGGIFIKRSFADNEVYKATLRQYIGYLMEKRFPLTWSFEGTRSRLGKLMPPKFGILKYVLEGCSHSGARNIHIIPVAVTYDLLRDAEEYAREQSGVPKAPESLSWMVGYIRSLAKPMGKIYVDFGEPVILPEAPDPDDKLALSKVAFQVAVEVNRVTPITLPALISMSLLAVFPRALTEEEVIADVDQLVSWCAARELRHSPDFDKQYAENMETQLQLMIDEGIISRFDGGRQVVYGIVDGQAPVASYYRNTIVHYFVNQAITELALQAAIDAANDGANLEAVFWAEVDNLRDLFKFEFFYPPSDVFRREIAGELERIAPDWQSLFEQGKTGLRELLGRFTPLVAHRSLQMFIEAYAIAATVLAEWPKDEFSEQDCVEHCMSFGKQAFLQRRISSDASVGKLLFSTAFKVLQSRELVNASRPDVIEARKQHAARLDELMRRIEYIRASSIASRGALTLRDSVHERL
ncbi:glycerol-3-phosphate acyltransferase [Luminiphilus syltensis NOR5-1B]|uniref:Glycerol-3-phosphate acyltransferase n=1 Tax=Luminiphilus syltensis NOR5-1B TaxID=565045 RepID=B8KTL1_9GAMM|nr:glycerol-3-phosphate 1-O-acyltransferase [Luminiphilus syltensis]EED35591.1 glycerol-3-phosphate acyltransferase [Luminiphilus syltensis NOR5-1B]